MECEFCLQIIDPQNIVLHKLYCENNSQQKIEQIKNHNQDEQESFKTFCHNCKSYINKNNHFCQDSYEICFICKKQFSKQNIEQHKLQCQFQKITCEYCKTDIFLKDIELHKPLCKKKNQKLYFCEICKNQLQYQYDYLFDMHKEFCQKNIQTIDCQYCSLSLLIYEQEHHQMYCGSKTKECSFCQKIFLVKDLQQHELDCFRNKNNKIKFQSDEIIQTEPVSIKVVQQVDEDDIDEYLQQIQQCNQDDEEIYD